MGFGGFEPGQWRSPVGFGVYCQSRIRNGDDTRPRAGDQPGALEENGDPGGGSGDLGRFGVSNDQRISTGGGVSSEAWTTSGGKGK